MRKIEEIKRTKEVGTFGASYLYPMFMRVDVKYKKRKPLSFSDGFCYNHIVYGLQRF